MARPSIKAVCFDMDGLLFNTEELYDELSHELLSRRGKKVDPDLTRRMTGLQPQPAWQLFIEHYGLSDTIPELQAEGDEFFDQLLPARLAPMPGAVSLLQFLSHESSRPLALTTSSSRRGVERIMSICDISHHFEFWLTAEDVSLGKPHPEIYATAADRHGISVSEMLVLEDSENGCRAGVAAGAHVVAVPSSPAHAFPGVAFIAESLEDPRIKALLA
jgi:HAD superfamily hydrolase (TIGR01509 family)